MLFVLTIFYSINFVIFFFADVDRNVNCMWWWCFIYIFFLKSKEEKCQQIQFSSKTWCVCVCICGWMKSWCLKYENLRMSVMCLLFFCTFFLYFQGKRKKIHLNAITRQVLESRWLCCDITSCVSMCFSCIITCSWASCVVWHVCEVW